MAQDKIRDACMAATTPAAFARAIGREGRPVRNVLRGKLGVYVSKGDPFDDATRSALYDVLTGVDGALDAWNARTK